MVAMKRTTEQVAVHKERNIVPLRLTVTKLSGVGEDTLFIGIMEVSSSDVCLSSLLRAPVQHSFV
jgi:hypothetical protein